MKATTGPGQQRTTCFGTIEQIVARLEVAAGTKATIAMRRLCFNEVKAEAEVTEAVITAEGEAASR